MLHNFVDFLFRETSLKPDEGFKNRYFISLVTTFIVYLCESTAGTVQDPLASDDEVYRR